MFRMKTQEGGMPHKHNKPRIYKSAGQADIIIETALLIMIIIAFGCPWNHNSPFPLLT